VNVVHDLDAIHEQQQTFRESERAAIEEATALPVAQAREALAELAAKQQAWLDEQRQLLRDRARERAQTSRADRQLALVERDLSRGWSM
jgi:hypothetical protein